MISTKLSAHFYQVHQNGILLGDFFLNYVQLLLIPYYPWNNPWIVSLDTYFTWSLVNLPFSLFHPIFLLGLLASWSCIHIILGIRFIYLTSMVYRIFLFNIIYHIWGYFRFLSLVSGGSGYSVLHPTHFCAALYWISPATYLLKSSYQEENMMLPHFLTLAIFFPLVYMVTWIYLL